MSVIFISYRRSDSPDVTGRIYDRLLNKYTEKQVFKDVDSMPMGISFPLHIKQMLGKSRAVLVIIGPNWLDAQDEHGNLRLEHPDDYVRLEIEIALRSAVPVIPVLVSHAGMPSSSDLPKSIRQLARRNGMSIRPDPDFNNDIARLCSELDKLEKLIVAKPGKLPSGKFPALRSAIGKRVAAISTELSPDIRPAAMEGSSTIIRERHRAATGETPALGALRPRNRFVLPLAGLGLLICCVMGLWAADVFQWPTLVDILSSGLFAGSRGSYDLTGGNRFVHFGRNGPQVVLEHYSKDPYIARVYDLETGKAVAPPLKLDESLQIVEFSPDGKRVVTFFGGKTARVWDTASGQALTPPLEQSDGLKHAAFSPDSQRLLTTGANEVRVWRAGTGKEEFAPPLKLRGYGNASRYSQDGKRVLTTAYTAVRVWDPRTGNEMTPPLEHAGSVLHVGFSPDGKRVVTASADKTARVWDAASGKEITPPFKHEGALNHACFSPDGKRIVTASDDKTARVWDVATGQELIPPLRHEDEVRKANFSADGARVVTSAGHAARVWDAATGRALTPPINPGFSVINAVFSPNGKHLVIANWFSCWLWDAETGKELNKVSVSP